MGSAGDRKAGAPEGAGQAERSPVAGPQDEARRGEPAERVAVPASTVPASPSGSCYAIRVDGHLDAHWSEWLEGMTLTHEEGGVTRLEGPVRDQAALYGLLNKLRDLRLALVTVQRLGSAEKAPRSSEEPPDSAAG
jgi:hypothetical protein